MAHSQYLTYDEYAALGGAESRTAYPVLELKARKRIDYLTDSRVQYMAVIPEAVKLCAFALMEMESKAGIEAQTKNPAVTSFSTDGYSESYANVADADTASRQMQQLVHDYLFGEVDDYGIPLLYRGCRG